MVRRCCSVLLPGSRESRQKNPTSDQMRAAFPFRTATGMGAATTASSPPSHGIVRLGFAVLPQTNFPSARVRRIGLQRSQQIANNHKQHPRRQGGEDAHL